MPDGLALGPAFSPNITVPICALSMCVLRIHSEWPGLSVRTVCNIFSRMWTRRCSAIEPCSTPIDPCGSLIKEADRIERELTELFWTRLHLLPQRFRLVYGMWTRARPSMEEAKPSRHGMASVRV